MNWPWEDARHGHQRPKIEEYGDTLFCVMHSIRNRGRYSFLSVRERAEREPHLLRRA